MFTSATYDPGAYSPAGDMVVLVVAHIISIFIGISYIGSDKKRFRIIMCLIVSIFFSTAANIGYQLLLKEPVIRPVPIYILRLFHHILVSVVIYMYIQYLREPLGIPPKSKKKYAVLSLITLCAAVVVDILGSVFRFGFYVSKDGGYSSLLDVFEVIYACMIINVTYILVKYRRRMLGKVLAVVLGSVELANIILIIQMFMGKVSLTSLGYFLPVVSIVFMFHSNPFNVELGTVSGELFPRELKENSFKGREMIILSCYLKEFSSMMGFSTELKTEFYRYFRENIRRGVLYSFPNEHYIVTLTKSRKIDNNKAVEKMLGEFVDGHTRFHLKYKVVIIETSKNILDVNDYFKIVEYIETKLDDNTIYKAADEDIKEYYKKNYILSQLEDISAKNDLSDPRVLVYCQPVYNINTGKYDTAEALMRLKLDETGMVFPDQFIPLAEQYNHIHGLSMIILNKTCCAVKGFIEEGYFIKRISVNFSTIDLRFVSFCDEVREIIGRNGIDFDKIAVEITESRSEADFNLMKQRVIQLQDLGIKFYLDDFGTGYSNFERIMEIPFDIIKFDRSMLSESFRSDSSQYMVKTFANMFNDLKYAVLFEGVENENDEDRCIMMKAQYLQGYKYSKPIPIDDLRKFLSAVS